MTHILTPADNVQAALDAYGGPGAEFILSPGDYRQEIVLRGSRESNNGAHGNPMRIVLKDGARLLPYSDSDDTITFQAARYVTLEGENVERCQIVGPNDDSNRRQAVHIHSSPKQGRYPLGLTIKGLTVLKRGGDAIKHSEGIGCTFSNLILDGAGGTNEESLLDANKFALLTVRDVLMRNLRNSGLILKGGGVSADVRNLTIRNVEKGIEVGGYEGSGYWPFLIEQMANGGADLIGDPYLEEMRHLLHGEGNRLMWGARFAHLHELDVEATRYPFRTIDAWDVHVTGRLVGSEDPFFTSSVDVGRGNFFSSNVWINGEQVVPQRHAPTPAAVPAPEPVQPAPAPEPEPTPTPTPVADILRPTGGSETWSVGKNAVEPVTLAGWTLAEVMAERNDKSASLQIFDLRKIDGPRLTFKGRDMRDRLTVTEADGIVTFQAAEA